MCGCLWDTIFQASTFNKPKKADKIYGIQLKLIYFVWNTYSYNLYRTCCFNYLRKRSSAPIQQQQPPSQSSNAVEYVDNTIWLTKGDLDKLIRKEIVRLQDSQAVSRLELNQKPPKKDIELPKATNSNQIDMPNNRDQIHLIYDI